MARRSRVVVAVVAVIALAGAGVAVAVLRHQPSSAAASADPTLTVTTVRRTDLSDNRMVAGTLGFGAARTIKGSGPGVVTKLPAVGSAVGRGTQLYRVDDQPITVLFGDTPIFRPIDKPGIIGPDVAELRSNLIALGYHCAAARADVSDTALLTALKHWQQSIGVTGPGKLVPGQVVVLTGAGRVSAVTAEPSDPADGPLLSVTATTKVVSVPMSATDAGTVRTGLAVTITLPNGKQVPGTVTAVSSSVTTDPAGNDTPKVTVTVTPRQKSDVTAFDAAPVQVRFTSVTRKGVLAVPVGALVALSEGGYALQRPDGSLIAATTGMFAGGLVEVSGPDVKDGTEVVTTP